MANIPENEKKILQEVDYLEDKYFTFDHPFPFMGLIVYPVLVKDYYDFLSASQCLTLNKNDSIEGIKQTHLDYLLSKIKDPAEGPMWSQRLSKLVELCFHVKPGFKCKKCGKHFDYGVYIDRINNDDPDPLRCDECQDGLMVPSLNIKNEGENENRKILSIDGNDITSHDFTRLRKFILYQNYPDYKDDSWVDKAIRDDQTRKMEIQSKNGGKASLERKLACITATTEYDMESLYVMSIRKFNMILDVINDYTEYKILKTGLSSGMVSLKDGKKIDHWIYKRDDGMYGASVDSDAFINKING